MLTIHPRRSFAIACLLASASAIAAPKIDEFPVPGARPPLLLTQGPDGAIWGGVAKGAVIRVTDDGAISTFPLANANTSAPAITTGPDENLWFTEIDSTNKVASVGRLTPGGQLREFPLPAGAGIGLGIASGSDGNLWFTDDRTHEAPEGDVGRITTEGVVTEHPVPSSAGQPLAMTAGPDEALWFTAHNAPASSIVRVSTDFQFTVFPLPIGSLDALGIATGADGNLWFTALDPSTKNGKIGRMTPQGEVTLFSIPAASPLPQVIARGPCLDLWFTAGAGIGRVTYDGHVTIFPFSDLQLSEEPGIAANARRDVWFSNQSRAEIARVALLGCRALAKISKESAPRPPKLRGR